jgi:thiamine biosynthesis protein ThiI
LGFPLDLLVIDAEYFYEALTSRVKPRYRCVLCKRYMMGVGSLIAGEGGMEALVTGDSLGQVASQTLTNLATVSDAASIAVLRPLIAFDKDKIVDLARRIGTFDKVQGDTGCRVVPRMPATHAGLEEIRGLEEILDMRELIYESRNHIRRYAFENGELVES